MRTEFFARYENFNDALAIYARAPDMGGMKRPVAVPMKLTFTEVPEGSYQEPTLTLHGNDGKALFQAMWDAGMRPNDGAGSGAEAAALRKHIAFAERMADGLLNRSAPPVGDQP